MSAAASPGVDPTRLVVAGVVGLAAAALHAPPLVAVAPLLGRSRAVLAAVALAALLWGGWRVERLERRALAVGPFDGVVTVVGRPSGGRAVARVEGAGEDVLVDVGGGGWLEQGRIAAVRGRLAPLGEPVAGYYANHGVHLELAVAEAVPGGWRGGVWGAVDALHRGAVEVLGADPPRSPQRALVAGIALGETSDMPRWLKDRFREAGLYHLVAVSGQNVALVVALTLLVLAAAGVIGAPARAAALCLTVLYVLVTGAGPSIVRAGVAGVLVCAAWLASRPASRWHLWWTGALLVLAANPLSLFDPGFQLSFAAVAAIFAVVPRLERLAGQAVAVSAACTIATAPIAWWHFGDVAEWSVPANLLAVPAVAPTLWLGVLAIVAGAAWEPLATPLLAMADLLANYLLWVADVFA